MSKRVVIAGAGHAAGQVIASLRQHKFEGQIVLVGEERYLPYQRPPLSKKILAGEMPAERLYYKPSSFYEDADVETHLETRIESVDREAKSIVTTAGDRIPYDKLVLALGSRVRRLPVEGANLDNVHYLRNIADVESIRGGFEAGKRLVVIGAGDIGLEVAAVACYELRCLTRGFGLLPDRAYGQRRSVSSFIRRCRAGRKKTRQGRSHVGWRGNSSGSRCYWRGYPAKYGTCHGSRPRGREWHCCG